MLNEEERSPDLRRGGFGMSQQNTNMSDGQDVSTRFNFLTKELGTTE